MKKLLTLCVVSILCNLNTFASVEQKVLLITGMDPARTVALENSDAIVIEDPEGGFGALRIVSEKKTVDQTYTYEQLITMHGAPITYSGFTIMYVDTRDFTKEGGILIIKYVKNVLAFKKEYGLAEFEIVKDRSLNKWVVYANDQAGRREVTHMHLILNAGNILGSKVPVGVRAIEFK